MLNIILQIILALTDLYLERVSADRRTRAAYDEFLRQLGDQVAPRGTLPDKFDAARKKNLAKIMEMSDINSE